MGATNILILEDDVNYLNTISTLVKDFHKESNVHLAKNLTEAERCLRNNRLDLIISDYNLGPEKGTDLITSENNIQCPIVFLTGNNDSTHIKNMANKHPYHILEKGLFKAADLSNLISQALDENDKLRQRRNLVLVGETSAEAIHEINNPLMVISGKVATLRLKMQKKLGITSDDPLMKDLDAIDNAVSRASKAMLKTKAKVNDKGEEAEFKPVSFRSFLYKFFADNQEVLERDGVEVYYDLAEDFTVLIDSFKFTQVLSNLLNNSIDEFKEKEVKNRQIHVSTRVIGQEAVISFEDNGPGIPEHIRPKVFEKLFTTKVGSKGTGFGLSVCKAIMDLHKGEMELDNSTDKARFLLKLKVLEN